jgi:hypothetical protein
MHINLTDSKAAEGIEYCVNIDAPVHVPLFLGLLLELLCKTICPALLCHWFLSDTILRMTEFVSSASDFFLSPSCHATPATRSKVLTQVVVSATSLASISPGFEGATENLLCSLLRYRLQEGLHPDWQPLDNVLSQSFEKPLVFQPAEETMSEELTSVSACLVAANRLVNGSESEVSPPVRKRVYGALGRLIKHYPPNSDGEPLISAGDIAIHGMTDKDRTVRITSGSVCQSRFVVQMLTSHGRRLFAAVTTALGTSGIKRTEALFVRLCHVLDTGTIPVKETALITMGSIGKYALNYLPRRVYQFQR